MRRGVKQGMRGAYHRNVREQLRAENPKFHAGPNPLEREMNMRVIQPTTAEEIAQMTKILDETYGNSPNAQERQALELWKFQISSGTVMDEVKLKFLRGFYFWLLGRGTEEDTKKTMWGRGNAAVYNKEVAAYIDQFVSKRTQYAQQLQLLSMRVPSTLNGYYLYYKYIVHGNLKRVTGANGESFWDMTQEDYLQDFDIFKQEFEKEEIFRDKPKEEYARVIAPAALRDKKYKAFEGVNPYPITEEGLKADKELPLDDAKEVVEIERRVSSMMTSTGENHRKQLDKELEESEPYGTGQVAEDNAEPGANTGTNQGSAVMAVAVEQSGEFDRTGARADLAADMQQNIDEQEFDRVVGGLVKWAHTKQQPTDLSEFKDYEAAEKEAKSIIRTYQDGSDRKKALEELRTIKKQLLFGERSRLFGEEGEAESVDISTEEKKRSELLERFDILKGSESFAEDSPERGSVTSSVEATAGLHDSLVEARRDSKGKEEAADSPKEKRKRYFFFFFFFFFVFF
jgi:hypothetical protein